MPKKGPAIPISDTWKQMIRDRMKELEMSQNELARQAGITKSSLSAALSATSKQTTVMREIHKVLKLDPPPQITPDSLELAYIMEQLSERDQGELIGQARQMLANKKRQRPQH